MVLRARRAAGPAWRRHGLAGGAVPTHGGVVLSLERLRTVRALEPELWRAHVGRRRDDRHAAPPGARIGAAVRARPGRLRAVTARRQRRHQRRWPAHVQVRRHRQLGDRARAGARAGRAGHGRRPDPQGRRRLRRQVADDRLRGDARCRHRGVAEADPGARAAAAGRRDLRRPARRLRRAAGRARQRHRPGRARISRRRRARGRQARLARSC